MTKKDRFVCGLDVGTGKVCCLIARVLPDDRMEIAGMGYAPSAGLKKGIVVDLEQAAAAIRKAAQEAELKCSQSLDWVSVGISGDHIQSFNCRGALSVSGKHHEVTPDDVSQVIQAAQTAPLPPDREKIHVLPQEFFLDGRGDIRNPVGLTAQRLDVDVHLVTCDSSLSQNLINAVNRAQMRVKNVILPQLASAQAVLTDEEMEMGVLLLDIGAGTADVALIARNAPRHTSVLPVGGMNFSRDLAVGLRIAIEEAERIKKEAGSVSIEGIADDEFVEVVGIATQRSHGVPRRLVCQVLRERAIEMLELVRDQIARAGFLDQIVSGAVMTGGGSMMDGLLPLAEQILGMPVRQGVPQEVPGLAEELVHPIYATAVGLAMFAREEGRDRKAHAGKSNNVPWLVNRFLSWVSS